MSDQHKPEVFVDKTPDLPYDFEDFGMTGPELKAKYDREHPHYTNLAYNEAMKDINEALAVPTYWTWVKQQIALDDDSIPGNDAQGKAIEDPAQLDIIPAESIDQFAHVITAWHAQKMKELEQALAVPEGVGVEVTDGATGTVEEVILTGDALKAFRAGLSTAMAAFGNLPFVSIDAEEDAPESPADVG